MPMRDEDYSPRPLWRRWLLNRFVMVPLVLALIAGAWNLYASTHDDGIVTGQVVDAAGKPVEGAEVTLWNFNFTTFREASRAMSGPDGRFTFTDNTSHNIQLSAEKPGVGRAERVPLRLYFKAQNAAMKAPLRLVGGA